jgi:restriction endonuclease Mrr
MIKKFKDFLLESLSDVPESFVEQRLKEIESKLKNMFDFDKVENGEIKKFGESGKSSAFKNLNLELQSLEMSKYSKSYDNVKLKFSDEEFLYDFTFTIDLKDAVPQEGEEDFTAEKIENCHVKFKKYSQAENFDKIGELQETVKIDDIDEDLLSDLLAKLEGKSPEEEEFKIETE